MLELDICESLLILLILSPSASLYVEAAHIDLSKSGHNPGNVEKCPSVRDAKGRTPCQRDLLKKLLCQFKEKRGYGGALSPFLSSWEESRPTQQAASLANSLHALEQTHRTETVSKGWEIPPAAAFSVLNPAGQACQCADFIKPQNFLLNSRRVYRFLSCGSSCKQSGEGQTCLWKT